MSENIQQANKGAEAVQQGGRATSEVDSSIIPSRAAEGAGNLSDKPNRLSFTFSMRNRGYAPSAYAGALRWRKISRLIL